MRTVPAGFGMAKLLCSAYPGRVGLAKKYGVLAAGSTIHSCWFGATSPTMRKNGGYPPQPNRRSPNSTMASNTSGIDMVMTVKSNFFHMERGTRAVGGDGCEVLILVSTMKGSR